MYNLKIKSWTTRPFYFSFPSVMDQKPIKRLALFSHENKANMQQKAERNCPCWAMNVEKWCIYLTIYSIESLYIYVKKKKEKKEDCFGSVARQQA